MKKLSKRRKDILMGLIAVGAFFTLSSVGSFIVAILPINFAKWSITAKYIFNIGYELLTLFIIAWILKATVIENFKDYKGKIKYYLSHYIKYWFIALLLMYVSNFIIITINNNAIAQNEEQVRALFEVNPFLTFILASLVAPITEELVFRLGIRKIISNDYLFILLSGLIFGSMHIIGTGTTLMDWLYLIPYSIPGCVFAYTLVKSKNIFVPISLHMIHNTFALILQMVASFLF